jgi:hypothetical protein
MISEKFSGFTIHKTTGYWEGKPEKSLVIEIITDRAGAEYYIRQICLKIKGFNKQDSVWYTKQKLNLEIVP